MFVSRSLKSRFSLQKTHSVPNSVVGVETGTHTAAGKSSGTFHIRITFVVVEHDRVAEQGFEIGHGALQRPGRRGKPIEGQAPRTAQFQFGRGFVEQVQSDGVAADGLGARPQYGLQSRGQVLFFLAVGNQRHAGRQFGLALPEDVPRFQQFAEQVGDRAGQAFGCRSRGETAWGTGIGD